VASCETGEPISLPDLALGLIPGKIAVEVGTNSVAGFGDELGVGWLETSFPFILRFSPPTDPINGSKDCVHPAGFATPQSPPGCDRARPACAKSNAHALELCQG